MNATTVIFDQLCISAHSLCCNTKNFTLPNCCNQKQNPSTMLVEKLHGCMSSMVAVVFYSMWPLYAYKVVDSFLAFQMSHWIPRINSKGNTRQAQIAYCVHVLCRVEEGMGHEDQRTLVKTFSQCKSAPKVFYKTKANLWKGWCPS